MAEWSVFVQRPDGLAGDEDIRVTATTAQEAAQKALDATDPSFTEVVGEPRLIS